MIMIGTDLSHRATHVGKALLWRCVGRVEYLIRAKRPTTELVRH
jgi:hypothetical protein